MILEVSWDSLYTLSFGLSHFHGHGFWLVCEVALSECKVHVKIYMNSYMTSNESRFMVTWIIFQKSPLGDRLDTKSEDHGTLKSHNR